MDVIFELDNDEKNWWSNVIKEFRQEIVAKPQSYVDAYITKNEASLDTIRKDVSGFILQIRSSCWSTYLIDEVDFHKKVISHLIREREIPSTILQELVETELFEDSLISSDKTVLLKGLSDLVGDFAGRIMPYIYDLSLSTTNSRRSRAGNTFEAIIAHMMQLYGYPYEDQSSLGTSFYSKHELGKMVDGVIPGAEAYNSNRSKCHIVTMKTTLRERWQEVVEELKRTNIPHIYLLTLDDSISKGVFKTMKHHNITIVDYLEVKERFPEDKNIMSFEEYFEREIPHTLSYWERQND